MTQAEAQGVVSTIRASCSAGERIVFVSGNFNVVHPGHLRLLNFAASCGNYLVVGVHADGHDGAHLPEEVRLDSVRCIGTVSHAFILREPPQRFIARLQPGWWSRARSTKRPPTPSRK